MRNPEQTTVAMRVQCCICTDLLQSDSEVAAIVCGHVFHHTCLQQWIDAGIGKGEECGFAGAAYVSHIAVVVFVVDRPLSPQFLHQHGWPREEPKLKSVFGVIVVILGDPVTLCFP